MTKPSLVCGEHDVSPEHPSHWEFRLQEGKSKDTTLDGTIVKDLAWGKYEYVLIWDAMSVTDFDNLLALYLYHTDTGADITFTYEKWPQSIAGIEVSMEMPTRVRAGGSGNTIYYSKVSIVLTEKSRRENYYAGS